MTDSRSSRDRKRTPDVLAELLSADLQTGGAPSNPPSVSPAAAPPERKPQPPREPKLRPPAQLDARLDTWDVEIVTFQEHRGWRPRYVNGVEVQNWLVGSLIHDYVNQRGSEGWEVAAASAASHLYGTSDGLQVYFKRRKQP